jgi:DNA-binding NarL/FixJ family response regulator
MPTALPGREDYEIRVDILDSCPAVMHRLALDLDRQGIGVLMTRTTAAEATGVPVDVSIVDPDALEPDRIEPHIAAVSQRNGVLVLAGPRWRSAADRFRRAGAALVVDRTEDLGAVADAVRAVARAGAAGAAAVDGAVAAGRPQSLSQREEQVLRHISRGLTHGQVARRLGISQHTVDTYVKRIRLKLGLGNKAQLARAALLGAAPDAEPPGLAARPGHG